MTQYHAVMIDETGSEFGVSFEAADREEAYLHLQEHYEESSVAQLEDPEDTQRREEEIYDRVSREYDDDFYPDEEDY